MIPNSSISQQLASQRQQDMLAHAQRQRLVRRVQAEAAAAEALPEQPRRRLRRVLRAVVVFSGR